MHDVADAENEDGRADERDLHQHRGGERIENPAKLKSGIAHREPVEIHHRTETRIFESGCEGAEGHEKTENHHHNGKRCCGLTTVFAAKEQYACRQKWQRGNQPEDFDDPKQFKSSSPIRFAVERGQQCVR
jgi:hypothetical protein